jgi:hypothetical protein
VTEHLCAIGRDAVSIYGAEGCGKKSGSRRSRQARPVASVNVSTGAAAIRARRCSRSSMTDCGNNMPSPRSRARRDLAAAGPRSGTVAGVVAGDTLAAAPFAIADLLFPVLAATADAAVLREL